VERLRQAAEIREGKDTEQEIVKKEIEAARREEFQQETEVFEEALHQTSPTVAQTADDSQTTQTPTAKSEFLIQVENILADGLGDVYVNLEPSLRMKFKQKGEEIANKIERAIARGQAKIKQIIEWIKGWLRMIPSINRFFLEQEAKIKADRILAMVG
jgi:hypothetical protein